MRKRRASLNVDCLENVLTGRGAAAEVGWIGVTVSSLIPCKEVAHFRLRVPITS
jgi:hypothetical protein